MTLTHGTNGRRILTGAEETLVALIASSLRHDVAIHVKLTPRAARALGQRLIAAAAAVERRPHARLHWLSRGPEEQDQAVPPLRGDGAGVGPFWIPERRIAMMRVRTQSGTVYRIEEHSTPGVAPTFTVTREFETGPNRNGIELGESWTTGTLTVKKGEPLRIDRAVHSTHGTHGLRTTPIVAFLLS